MSNEKMREEYESWIISGGSHGKMASFEDDDLLWLAWQASRAAVVVELPEFDHESPDPLYGFAYSQKCREAIEAAGLKVKP